MVLKVFFVISFPLVFLSPTLASLPPGVMLHNCCTTLRDSATDIKKTSQKGAPKREQPNRSVLKRKTVKTAVLKKTRLKVMFRTHVTS